jgi:hypothetical protein
MKMKLEQIRDRLIRTAVCSHPREAIIGHHEAVEWLDAINVAIKERELLDQFVNDMKVVGSPQERQDDQEESE